MQKLLVDTSVNLIDLTFSYVISIYAISPVAENPIIQSKMLTGYTSSKIVMETLASALRIDMDTKGEITVFSPSTIPYALMTEVAVQ